MVDLNDPIKTPLVYLYSESGQLLASTIEGLELGIVDFTYEYDDEEEDTCTIRIQACNAKALDTLGIRRNSVLLVKWGYINGFLTHPARIAVRDISSKYGTNIIYTELKCTDLTTELKYISMQDIRKMPLTSYLDNYVTGSFNVVIRSGPDIVFKQGIHNEPESAFWETYKKVYMTERGWDPYITPLQKGEKPLLPKPNPNNIIDTGTWYVDAQDPIRKFYNVDREIVSVNRSPHSVIQEFLNTCPYGPWFITGRGDTLLIHNRNLGNGLYKNYIYAGESGELMDFTAETKYDSFEKQRITSTTLDPSTKAIEGLDIYLNKLNTQKSFKDIVSDKSITKEQRDDLLREFIQDYQAYKLYEIRVDAFDVWTRANPNIANYQDAMISYNQAVRNGDVDFDEDSGILAKRANIESLYIPVGQKNVSELKSRLGTLLIYSVPTDSPEDLENEEINALRKLEMETEEGNIIIEGDPYLTSEMVVGISNVQKVHEGKYYVKKCAHNISESGYRTSIEALKVKDSAIIRSIKSQSAVDKDREGEIGMKLPEFFAKQEEAFKRWNVRVRFASMAPSGNVTVPGTSWDVLGQGDQTTLEDILNNNSINRDQKINIIKKYLDDPQYKTYINDRLLTDPREL